MLIMCKNGNILQLKDEFLSLYIMQRKRSLSLKCLFHAQIYTFIRILPHAKDSEIERNDNNNFFSLECDPLIGIYCCNMILYLNMLM